MVIGSLVTNIVADLSKWGPNLNKARGQFANFARNLASVQTAISAITAGVAVQFVRSQVEIASKIKDTSLKLGLAVESYQRLAFGMEQVGGSASSLERNVAKLNQTLGRALSGNKSAADAFASLGLDPKQLGAAGGESAILQTISAIGKLPSAAQQAQAAVAIFGKGGQDMLLASRNMLEFVNSMMDIKPISAGAVDGLEKVGDEINTISTNARNLGVEMTAAFGPAISYLLNLMTNEVQHLNLRFEMAKQILRDMRGYTIPGPPAKHVPAYGEGAIFPSTPLPVGQHKNPNMFRPVQPRMPTLSGPRPRFWPDAPSLAVNDQMRQAEKGIAAILGLLPGRLQLAASNALGRAPSLGPAEGLFNGIGGMLAGLAGAPGAIGGKLAKFGIVGERTKPLEALVGGSREAYVASRENMRPRMKTNEVLEKQLTVQKAAAAGIAKIAEAVAGGVQLVGGAIGN